MGLRPEKYDTIYCYPKSKTLINKEGIRSLNKLHKRERTVTNIEALDMLSNPIQGNFDLIHLQRIHKQMFDIIYDWAGKLRVCDISKGGDAFCSCVVLKEYAENIFNFIKENNYFMEDNKEIAIEHLAQTMGDINFLHPFRDGNGRTQRQFIFDLGCCCGIYLDFENVSIEENLEASFASNKKDYSKFVDIFNRIAYPIPIDEQKSFVDKISYNPQIIFNNLYEMNKIPNRKNEFTKSIKTRLQEYDNANILNTKHKNNKNISR